MIDVSTSADIGQRGRYADELQNRRREVRALRAARSLLSRSRNAAYATKDDIARIEQKLDQFATKEELANHPTKADLKQELSNHPTKADLKQELEHERIGMRQFIASCFDGWADALTKNITQTLRRELNEDMQRMRVEFRADMDKMRVDLRADMKQMRVEMRAEISADMQRMRVELNEDLARHVNASDESMRTQIAAVDEKYADLPERVTALEKR